MPVKQHHSKTEWNQTAFEEMKVGWHPERLAKDEELLDKIFSLAADSPTLAGALAWAQENGVKFFIDWRAVDCDGYYTCSTGVVAIGADTATAVRRDPLRALDTLAHEIRHAWQDSQGLIYCAPEDAHPRDFSPVFINTVLIEADAFAYGGRARSEYRASKWGEPVPLELSPYLKRENDDLQERFRAFVTRKATLRFYGDFFSKYLGKMWGVYDGEVPNRHWEFTIDDVNRPGMNVYDVRDVLRLGTDFSGTQNYLAGLRPELLLKEMLSPSLANTFWGAANNEQKNLTTDLRKAHLRRKLAHRLQPARRPHPCP